MGDRLDQGVQHTEFDLSKLDLVGLEDEAFAVSADAGIVFHVNALGRKVLESLRSGASLDELSGTLARECAISPTRALDDLNAFSDSIKQSIGRTRKCTPIGLGSALPLRGVVDKADYAIFGRHICVHYPTQEIAAICHPPLAPFQIDCAYEEKLDAVIHETNTEVSVSCGAAEVSIRKTRGALMTALQRALLCHDQSDPGLFDAVVHAGSVVGGKGAWLIGGASGRGKSTLVTRLDAYGMRVFSDDLVPIDLAKGRALPLPLALSVKESGWAAVSRFRADITAVDPHVSRTGKRIKYIRPIHAALDEDRQGLPIAGLLLPQYTPGASALIQPVGLKEAMVSLCDRYGRFPVEPDDLTRLIDLLAPLPIYQLIYGDVEDVLPELSGLL